MPWRAGFLVAAAGMLLPAALPAQEPAPEPPRLILRFPAETLVIRAPLLEPGAWYGPRVAPALVAARWRARVDAAVASGRAGRLRGWVPGEPVEVPAADTAAVVEAPPPPRRTGFEALGRYADIGLDFRSRLEFKMDRLKNENCTAFDLSGFTPGCRVGFPTPSIAQQFAVRAGGIVSQRVHVSVDYDTEREFSANNNINVYYQGLEDEILRRVDVGNVTFQMPASRFLTSAIPSNSFGIQAEAQVGPLELRTIIAQQRGSALRSRLFTVGDRTTQPVDRDVRDLEFESGRFFFVVNPRILPSYPAVDVLDLPRELLPLDARIAQVRIYRLRAQSGQVGSNSNLGGIDAVAIRRDSPQRVGPFSWERLQEGRDYYLDPSGVWFALAARVGFDDFLAVSYITLSGDTVGTFPAVNRGGDTLELIYEPRRGPEVPTFDYELRNIYRVGGPEVTRNSVSLAMVLNESERPLDGTGTYLDRLGLARPNDPSTLDQFNRLFPRDRDPNGGLPIRDLFVVFPHTRPFADSLRLQPAERNDSLYRTATYLLSSQGPPARFRLRMRYEASGAGDRGTLSLGALQVREGSEKIFLGDVELVRGRDYQIAYDVGQITFLRPDSLFGAGTVQVRALFEENQRFDDAPKNSLGLAATYTLGPWGRINGVALFQREQSALTRPPLGFEPRSATVGGLSTELAFRPSLLTRALDRLPLIRTGVPSTFTVRGEVALSRPNPNQAGQAYVEEFEGLSARPITLVQNAFQLGSRPSSGRGLGPSYLAPTGEFSPLDAVAMTWQNTIDINGTALEFEAVQIDSSIVLSGASRQVESVLWMSLKPDTVGGAPDPLSGRARWLRRHTPGPRWRSITQPLDRTGLGIDLSRTEYLEFWVLEDADRTARQEGGVLVFDFGTVFEDAVAVGPDSFQVSGRDTVFSGERLVGAGRLDSEKDPLTNVFNAAVNDRGIHADLMDSLAGPGGIRSRNVPTCQLPTGGFPTFPLGDLASNCTRRNGFADTEDLDGDNRLDVTVGAVGEDFVRYVFPIGDERFLVRSGGQIRDQGNRFLTWRLYRIPFRTDTIQVGVPSVRQVRAVRITLAAPDRAAAEREFFFALARLRLVGAPWVKRAGTPIAGLSGATGTLHGEVIASVISTESRDLGYTPPPGVGNAADRFGASIQFGSQQINEQSLRLVARDLRLNERAESYLRFSDEGDKNFLKYRTLRAWARGRGPGWDEGDLEAFIKVGRDEHNFYLFRARARTDTWEPEMVIQLDRWLSLRATIEAAWLRGERPSGAAACGGDTLAYVACDGPYLVHVRDPATGPPNLARVSEVAVGFFRPRETVAIGETEVWIDDIRLGGVVSDVGTAMALDARLTAADVGEVTIALNNRSPDFRQLGEDPRYIGSRAAVVSSSFQVGKLLPESWGMAVPVTFQHVRTREEPFYLTQGDVRAEGLGTLREPRGTSTTWSLLARRVRPGRSGLERLLVDPVTVTALHQRADATTTLSEALTTNRQASLGYANPPDARTVYLGLAGLAARFPRFIRESEFGRALRNARLRWNPAQVRFGSALNDSRSDRATFRVPVLGAADTAVRPLPSVTSTWRNDAGVDLRPFSTLTARADYSRTQDLQDYGDSTAVGRLLRDSRESLVGRNVGFERGRSLITSVAVTPVVTSWLRPRATVTTTFGLNRDPNAQDPVRLGRDSSGPFAVPITLSNSRRRELGATIDLGLLARRIAGDSGWRSRLLRGILPADLSEQREFRSGFDRAPFLASLGYQLGLGGLDRFRFQEGVPATSATDSRSRTAAGGLELPAGIRVRWSYQDLQTENWIRRGTIQSVLRLDSREWPSGTLAWLFTPPGAVGRVLTSVAAQTRYRYLTGRNAQSSGEAGPGGATSETRSRTISPTVTLSWAGGVVTAAQFSRALTDATTSGNITRTEREDWGGTVSLVFRPPAWMVRLPNPVRTSMTVAVNDVLVCLIRAGTSDCVPVADSRRRQADLRLDTGFSTTVNAGASVGYVFTEQRHTATRFSQVIATVFAEINFQAGQVR